MAANNRFIVFACFILAALPGSANAAVGLIFKDDVSARQKALIQDYFQQKPPADLTIAKADLNDDGTEELIAKANCQAALCDFHILAESHEKLVELADIKAQNIQLSDTFTSGVRNIIAFKNASNDFDHSVYIWEPQARRYMIEK